MLYDSSLQFPFFEKLSGTELNSFTENPMLVDSDEHGILLAFSVSKQFKQFRSLLPV